MWRIRYVMYLIFEIKKENDFSFIWSHTFVKSISSSFFVSAKEDLGRTRRGLIENIRELYIGILANRRIYQVSNRVKQSVQQAMKYSVHDLL